MLPTCRDYLQFGWFSTRFYTSFVDALAVKTHALEIKTCTVSLITMVHTETVKGYIHDLRKFMARQLVEVKGVRCGKSACSSRRRWFLWASSGPRITNGLRQC